MTKDTILQMLQQSEQFLSGEQMSRQLGISRMAVCKAIDALRQEGYCIEAVPRRGYRLAGTAMGLSKTGILAALGAHPWRDRVTVLESIDSTNTYAKQLPAAPHGTIIVANQQTGGRGRLGRSFYSPKDRSVYMSVVLRLIAEPTKLLHLTALAAEAVCQAVFDATGLRPGIKWTNDLVIGNRKLCGILTELTVEAESGMVDTVIIGAGVNCNYTPEDFPEEVRPIATSLAMELGHPIDRNRLAAAMICRLKEMSDECLSCKADWISRYAADCITIGKDVQVISATKTRIAHADGIDENAALLVTYDNGEKGTVFSGEVSVRGMYGYVDSDESLSTKKPGGKK